MAWHSGSWSWFETKFLNSFFSIIKNDIRESIARERRLLENQKQDELNNIKQTIEREKDEFKRKLQ